MGQVYKIAVGYEEPSYLSFRFNHLRIFHLETVYPGYRQAPGLVSPQDLRPAFSSVPVITVLMQSMTVSSTATTSFLHSAPLAILL